MKRRLLFSSVLWLSASSAALCQNNPGAFSSTGSMSQARADHTATLLPKGNVLIAGGQNNSGFLASAEIFEPSLGMFVITGNMNSSRAFATATRTPNGQVLIAGGQGGVAAGSLSSTEFFDPASSLFTLGPNMSTPRLEHTATRLLSGKVLIAGGETFAVQLASAELYDPVSGAFVSTGSMTTFRLSHTATLLQNGKVLIAGGIHNPGGTNVAIATAELYDPDSGSFNATGSMSTPRAFQTATLLSDGRVLLCGGVNLGGGPVLASAEIYDPSTGAFTPTGDLSTPREQHTATLLPNGNVLIAGGFNATATALTTAELYDPVTGTFSPAGDLTTARYKQSATLLANGQVLIVGGIGSSGTQLASAELYSASPTPRAWLGGAIVGSALYTIGGGTASNSASFGGSEVATVEVYDTGTNAWSSKTPLQNARFGLTASAVNGQIYAIGGTSGLSSVPLSLVEQYDPGSNVWASKSSMPTPRWKLTSSVVNGLIYAIGGGPSGNQCGTTGTVEAYDRVVDVWSTKTSMPTPRWGAASAAINNLVYVVGGSLSCAQIIVNPSSALEAYDTAIDAWASQTPMPTARWDLAAAAANGKIYAIGGWDPVKQTVLTTVEEFDPTTNSWTARSPMPTARSGLAVVTINGKIYAFGGSDNTHVLAVLEAYDPLADTWTTLTPGNTPPPPPTLRTLTVASTDPDSGVNVTVSPSDNIGHGSGNTPLTLTYNDGTVVTLTAAPTAAGNNLSNWTGCDSTAGTSCILAMSADRTVTANYVNPIPPLPLPTITAVLPSFGIQGQTITNFTVNGTNFLSTSILSFSGDPDDFVIAIDPVKSTPTLIVASVTIASTASVSIRDVIVRNPDTQSAVLSGGFRVVRENLVRGNGLFDTGLNEPSIAVDPVHSQHAVVGYNRTPGFTKECAWSESRDEGATWTPGSLSFPSGFHGLSDPWLRYSPKGQLFYSCIAVTDWNLTGRVHLRKIGVFVAKSLTGFASDFGVAVAVVPAGQEVCFGLLIDCEEQGGVTDHPSLGVLRKTDGTDALVACWEDFFKPTGQTYLHVAFSGDGGTTWPTTKTLSANVGPCVVGEGNGEVAITYWDLSDQSLKLLTSPDGVTWPSAQKAIKLLPDVSQLLLDSDGRPESTTELALSEPYALGIPLDVCPAGQKCMRIVWQTRSSGKSRIYIADSSNSWVSVPLPKPDADEAKVLGIPQDPERFLPGAGSCPDLIGAYESSDDSGSFRYKVWSLTGNAVTSGLGPQTIFRSGQDMSASGAITDPTNHPGFGRIGDYTTVDCSQKLGWAVWTDRRNTILSPDLTHKHVNEIWVGVIPLK